MPCAFLSMPTHFSSLFFPVLALLLHDTCDDEPHAGQQSDPVILPHLHEDVAVGFRRTRPDPKGIAENKDAENYRYHQDPGERHEPGVLGRQPCPGR